MPNYLIGYLSFSTLEHIRKYPASFIKRQEHTQILNAKDRVFLRFSDQNNG